MGQMTRRRGTQSLLTAFSACNSLTCARRGQQALIAITADDARRDSNLRLSETFFSTNIDDIIHFILYKGFIAPPNIQVVCVPTLTRSRKGELKFS